MSDKDNSDTNSVTTAATSTNTNEKDKNKLLIDSLVSDSFFHDAYGNTMKKSLVFTQNDLDMSFLAQIKNGINLNFGDNSTAEKLNKFINI